jgi:hypothetical protein
LGEGTSMENEMENIKDNLESINDSQDYSSKFMDNIKESNNDKLQNIQLDENMIKLNNSSTVNESTNTNVDTNIDTNIDAKMDVNIDTKMDVKSKMNIIDGDKSSMNDDKNTMPILEINRPSNAIENVKYEFIRNLYTNPKFDELYGGGRKSKKSKSKKMNDSDTLENVKTYVKQNFNHLDEKIKVEKEENNNDNLELIKKLYT